MPKMYPPPPTWIHCSGGCRQVRDAGSGVHRAGGRGDAQHEGQQAGGVADDSLMARNTGAQVWDLTGEDSGASEEVSCENGADH